MDADCGSQEASIVAERSGQLKSKRQPIWSINT
jgi:hypothetical protein